MQTSTTIVTSLTLSNFRHLILSLVAEVHAACSLSPHNVLHSPSLIMDLWLAWYAYIYYSATFLLALLWRLIMRREEGRWTGVTSALLSLPPWGALIPWPLLLDHSGMCSRWPGSETGRHSSLIPRWPGSEAVWYIQLVNGMNYVYSGRWWHLGRSCICF